LLIVVGRSLVRFSHSTAMLFITNSRHVWDSDFTLINRGIMDLSETIQILSYC
jgi:hypothetical protein